MLKSLTVRDGYISYLCLYYFYFIHIVQISSLKITIQLFQSKMAYASKIKYSFTIQFKRYKILET